MDRFPIFFYKCPILAVRDSPVWFTTDFVIVLS